jgi:hypothetical protein
MNHKEQLGFLTVACNDGVVDYLKLAYAQALCVKKTQKNNQFAVVVDGSTKKQLNEKYLSTFDYVIEAPEHSYGRYGTEAFLFELTPFKETVKLESDLLFTRSIDHWINAFRLRDIVLSTGCKNYRQEASSVRAYRKTFDDNGLPDVYNGLMYFRFTQTAKNFFDVVKSIFANWATVRNQIKNCREDEPSTDLVFALAAQIIGPESCTLPAADFINFVHMKPAINEFDYDFNFNQVFVSEFDQGMIRINNINQYHPLHYYDKNFITDEIIEYYEQ